MKVDDLIERARKLKEKGLTIGEIASELNVSRETAMWLLAKVREDKVISDVYVDLRAISNPYRMRNIANAMADMIYETVDKNPDVVVGIATSGIPIATFVAEALDADLSMYYPKKLKWEGEGSRVGGVFSENFAKVDEKNCVIVDNVITTGNTIRETIEQVKNRKGSVLCSAVIIDKRGLSEIEGIPLLSLFKIVRI
ncbi:orotate phosphoribosyltransferase-like protein [Archaeoglobus profundus]|uniref:Transcriptional regulator GfcR n=1 Tax=Archaeoglobus profundus (strain DSM 5631 / JCM 9629 / NBRC 100127 / Av18) TaxID=572546 RepID=D2RG32_ARCPA|nr:orotate phosphoribosyltransferase-like protein [Archaeoglobus profundus]ADB57257.1 phosphoribosyltransferase [Archaeoglobus profundus DSM 5631]